MKTLKPWIVVVLVFAAGVAVGICSTRLVVRQVIARAAANPELVRDRIEREFVRELRLTPEQQPKVHGILERRHEQMRALRRDFQPRVAEVLKQSEQDIRALLNEQQREKFDRWLKRKALIPRAVSTAAIPARDGDALLAPL